MQNEQSTEVIAEAGSNHNGSLTRAKELVSLAARAGASSVKFQFIFPEGLYVPEFFDGQNYVPNPAFQARQGEQMPEDAWADIWDHALESNIQPSASAFCSRGIALLSKLGAPYVKIASTDLTNHELIGQACSAFQRVIISTGMASLSEVDCTVRFVRSNFPKTNLQLMHCVSEYPCPLQRANVQRVRLLRECFGLPVGYSDHTAENTAAAMAVTQGATFFEKHFTVNHTLPGFDHAHALEEQGLTSYIQSLKAACASFFSTPQQSNPDEDVTKIRARRGVYASRDLKEGHTLTRDDLLFVRPSTDFTGNDLTSLIGKRLPEPVRRHEPVSTEQKIKRGASNWQKAADYWHKEMTEKGMDTDGTPNMRRDS